MKVGDLVELSAAGQKSGQNIIIRERCHYGLVTKIRPYDDKFLYTVRFFTANGEPFNKQNYFRYELKRRRYARTTKSG